MDFVKNKKEFLDELKFVDSMGRIIFLCPFNERSKKRLLGYYCVIFLILFTAFQLFLTLCLTKFDNWLDVISIAPNIGACVMSIIKYTSINNNRELYAKISDHFHIDLWELIPNHSVENIETFIKFKKYTTLITKCMVYITIVLCVIVDSFPWLIMTYQIEVLGKDYPCLYPFDAWYPFDKFKWYWVAYIWEGLMTALVIYIYLATNVFHINYIAAICMELTLLGNWLKALITRHDIENIKRGRKLNETNAHIKNKLKFVIRRYALLNLISSGLDRGLGIVMLVSYIFDGAFICLTAFSALVIDDTFKSVRYFSFFLSLIVEMLILCIFGQVLKDHSVTISEMVYSSYWIYADEETKKILLMLMRRTQKPFKLTAKNYVVMELNTFSGICSSSYSMFNLLRNIYYEA